MKRVLRTYTWILEDCTGFYQIPYEDCMKFFEDFKKRSIASSCSLKPYYLYLYRFYKKIDNKYAMQCFHKYKMLPRGKNANCAACDRNDEIGYFLSQDNLEMANELAKDIENYTLTCGGERNSSWLRMKAKYMSYYMEKKILIQQSNI